MRIFWGGLELEQYIVLYGCLRVRSRRWKHCTVTWNSTESPSNAVNTEIYQFPQDLKHASSDFNSWGNVGASTETVNGCGSSPCVLSPVDCYTVRKANIQDRPWKSQGALSPYLSWMSNLRLWRGVWGEQGQGCSTLLPLATLGVPWGWAEESWNLCPATHKTEWNFVEHESRGSLCLTPHV
jgi:hypothetical protein